MANDISDFEIAKITIGESLLKYYTAENELRVNEIYDPQSKLTKVIILDPSLYPYEKLQVTYAGKNQVILSIEGLIDYENNFSGCIKQMTKISKELDESFVNIEFEKIINKTRKHPVDKTGKSEFRNISFNFEKGGNVNVRCYDWSSELSKTKGWIDGLSVSIDSRKSTIKKVVKENIEPLPSLTIENDNISFSINETYYALLIGNDDYKYWSKLSASINDVETISKVLKNKYNFKIETLINATSEEIKSKLFEYAEKISEKDNLLIYYAGHGDLNVNMSPPRAYWIPVDAGKKTDSKWINTEDVSAIISLIPAKHILIMVDSCYSGSSMRGSTEISITTKKQTQDEKFLEKLLLKKTRQLITSGGKEPVLDASISNHSLFAYKFLDILNQNDGYLTGSSVWNDLNKYHVNLNQNPEIKWLKEMGDLGGDFVFISEN